MEEAAIGGHPWARYNLGYSEIEAAQTGTTEERMRSLDKAVKHWIMVPAPFIRWAEELVFEGNCGQRRF
jgi:hypothetical protein